jgi:hypothetical protein
MRGAIPLLPQYVFMAWCLVKHRDNFTLLCNNIIIIIIITTTTTTNFFFFFFFFLFFFFFAPFRFFTQFDPSADILF